MDPEKKPIQILRERRGGVPKALAERHKKQLETGRQIAKALSDGPKTVPELAKATGIPGDRVLWHVMSMKKYGKVVEGEEQKGYYRYALKEKGP